tara:strand:+ start:1797 stop:1946 length:150 start_codon:yes stop_codon:yes gene_type:complete
VKENNTLLVPFPSLVTKDDTIEFRALRGSHMKESQVISVTLLIFHREKQ